MTFDYARTAATAGRLLAKFGRQGVLRVASDAQYDPATGTYTSSFYGRSSVDYTITVVVLDYEQTDIDGTSIRIGDQRAYIDPAVALTPKTGDSIVIGEKIFKVINSKPLAPAGVTVLHDVQVRGEPR